MKIAFFSDIHANLPALEAFFDDLKTIKPDAIYCLGDLVGYHVWPNEVVEMIRENRIPTIMGNHDEATSRIYADEQGSSNGALTQKMLKSDHIEFLTSLPRSLKLNYQFAEGSLNLLLVHGSVKAIDDYLTPDYPEQDLLEMLDQERADVILCGHTHQPYHRKLNDKSGVKHVINIGSVGKPKDGDPRLCYVIVDLDTECVVSDPHAIRVSFRRVQYDIEKAAHDILESEFDDDLARRLRDGV